MYQEILFLIGKIIYGGFFIFTGLNHFIGLKQMAEYAGLKGVPAPAVMVIVSGIMLLLGGLSILLGFYPVAGIILLAVFLIPTSFKMHNFWAVEDQQMKQVEMVMFLKNMALLGALLMFLAIPQPWPFSIMP